jgi:hypothetical protein
MNKDLPLKFAPYIVALTFLSSTAFLLLEMAKKVNIHSIPWGQIGFKHLIIYSALFGLFSLFSGKFFKNYKSYLLALSTLTVGAVGLAPFITVLLFSISTILIGSRISRPFKNIQDIESIKFPIFFGLGVGFYSFLINLLAFFPVNYSGIYFLLLILPIFLFKYDAIKLLISFDDYLKNFRVTSFYSLLICYFVGIYFLVSLLPELGYDALSIHQLVPAFINEHHLWNFDANNYVMAVIPMGADWIFTLMYLLGGEAATRLINFIFLIFIIYLVGMFSYKESDQATSNLSILLWLSFPITFLITSCLFVENLLSIYILSAFILLLKFRQRNNHKFIYLAAIFLGLSIFTKFSSLLFLPPFFILLLASFHSYKNIYVITKVTLISILFLILCGISPYIVAYLKTGNPVFPFFNAVFKSEFFDIQQSFDQPLYKQGFSLSTLYDVTFNSQKYIEGLPGSFGWVFFVVFPVTIIGSFVYKNVISLYGVFISITFIFLIFISQSYLRYIYPAIPIFILSFACFLDKLKKDNIYIGKFISFIILSFIPLNLLFLPAANGFYRNFDINFIWSDYSARQDYVHRTHSIRSAIDFLNASYGPNIKVAFFSHPLTSRFRGDPLYVNWYNYNFEKEISSIQSESDLIDVLDARGINLIVLDEDFYRNKKVIQIIKSISNVERVFGSISIYSIRDDFKFKHELLSDPNLKDVSDWNLSNESVYRKENASLVVTVSNNASQSLAVDGNREYRLTVHANCYSLPTQLRLQINWLDKSKKFIETSLRPVDCVTNLKNYFMDVRSPSNARYGVIYATGHTEIPVEFHMLSLKR